jgi:protein involved in polysaccharide export with SLBB domain
MNITNKIKIFIVLFFCFATIIATNAQDILRLKDISQIKVEMLSDDEILQYKQQLASNGLSESQAEQIALQRGLPASEIIKLRARLAKLDNSSTSTNAKLEPKKRITVPKNNDGRDVDSSQFDKIDYKKELKPKTMSSLIFGGDLFNNDNITFEPNLRIATPKNYTIGPDDEVVVDVFGYQEVNQKLTVSTEGNISIPFVGLINVSGLTVDQATQRIKQRMIKSGYSSIGSGQSQLQISIGKIRSIKIIVIGEAKKVGTYTLSSLSSLFSALYAAGGPNENGSLRSIELIRNNKTIETFDAYQFLLHANQSSDVRLMDRDVIRIPIAKNQVTLTGEIKKPAIFELKKGEKLTDILEYAGGFTANAYTATINIVQTTDKEKMIRDVDKSAISIYEPQNGDIIEVGKILDKFSNKISIKGAVYRPGNFQLSQGITLSQLIKKAEGLKDDAFKQRGVIIRLNEDYTKEVISFNPINIVTNAQQDIELKKNDEVIIGNTSEFKEDIKLTIEGQVRKPGLYQFYDSISLKDLIFTAGGFTEASSIERIEIARRIDLDKVDSKTTQIAEVIKINSEKDLDIKGNDIKLKPWDVVNVRTKPGYKNQIKVKIEGEVLYPGIYVLSSKSDKVSDLLKRCGGLTNQAFAKAVSITRINKTNIIKDTSDALFKKLRQQTRDSSSNFASDYTNPTLKIGLDIEKLMQDSLSTENVFLQEDDVINVPKYKREIKISGEILFPTEVVFIEGKKLDYYIDRAGGFTDDAQKRKVYVIKPNGVAAKTKHFLFFKKYPKVEEGSEILVPKIALQRNKKLSTAEVIGISTAVASMAGVVIAIINLVK